LYFVSSRQGLRDVYAVDVQADGRAGSEPCRVSMGLGVHSIALSAGGQRLAYVAYAARSNIWSVPVPSTGTVDASSATAVTAGNQIVEGLKVSRDGRWLVYDSTLFGNSQIFRVPIAGGPAERLTINSVDDFNADLSPDGNTVVYHSFQLGNRDIFTQGIDGGQAQPVTSSGPEGQESYPLWAPDGEAILFANQARGSTLFIVRRTPSGVWGEPVPVVGASRGASWLPDGRSIAYASRGGLNVVAVDGGSPRLVYAPAPDSTDPRVERVVPSDDGRSLYFKSHEVGGLASFWSIAIEGGRPRQLVRFGPAQASSRDDFAAGAGRLYFTLEDRQANIVVADLTRPAR
jgi:Tol biopolymer transport system component